MLKNFILIFLILLVGLGMLYVSIFQLDPMGEQKEIAFVSLFFAIFSVITSFCTFLFFFLSEIFHQEKYGKGTFIRSFWRGMMMGIASVIFLILRIFGLARWWDLVFVITIFLVIQSILFGMKPRGYLENRNQKNDEPQ